MNILSAEKISKSYSEKVLFKDISIGISEGEKIGLIGINGTGKSTLLKVIAGIEPSDTGRIIYSNNLKIDYLAQSPDFESGTTILEQVFKGNSPVMDLIGEYENMLQKAAANPENSELQNRLTALIQRMDNTGAWSIETEAKVILTELGLTDFKRILVNYRAGSVKERQWRVR
jgi:ATP-binding cassette subfamily F protein uup